MTSSNRIYFLDNLRAFVIFLVIVLHASITYMDYAPEWWYVLNPETSLIFTMMVLVIDVPIMLIMFFVAGYFALPSLQKRGPAKFLQDKLIRVGLPWVFGALFLAPPTVYMIFISRDIPVGYLDFWINEFWGVWYQQSVYWFLGVLLLFFGLLSLAYQLSDRLRQTQPITGQPSGKLFLGFGGLMTAGFLLINQLYPADTWTHIYLFVFQPLRIPLYIGYFLLGLYAHRYRWFQPEGYHPRLSSWGVLWAVTGLLYLGYRLTIPTPAQTTLLLQAGNAILFNSFCLSSLIAGTAFFERYVNTTGPFWHSQAVNSYGIYYLHPLFLYPLAYLFISLPLPLFLKAFSLIIVATLLSWAASEFLLRRLPLLRAAFG